MPKELTDEEKLDLIYRVQDDANLRGRGAQLTKAATNRAVKLAEILLGRKLLKHEIDRLGY